ncbi:MAG: hypothetical protein ABIR24_10305 [Verrucomicrobiota bacterium]
MNKACIATFLKRAFAVATVLFATFVWLTTLFRFSAIFFALICCVVLFFISAEKRRMTKRVLCIGFIVLSLLPADISFGTRQGRPKFVPVIYGMVMGGDELFERERRGDLILGGCVVNGWAPMWKLVW